MPSIITKLKMTLAERAAIRYAISQAEEMKAFFDYNLMMGNIEDPSEEEEEEEE